MSKKILAQNKEGGFSHDITERFEAGVVLSGPEVKSVKAGQISLKGSYVSIGANNRAYLVNAYIAPYKPAKGAQVGYQPDQRRGLLLHKKELNYLRGKSKEKGLTIIPTSVYNMNGLIKLEIALAKGRKQADKREAIRNREIKRQIQRSLKR